MIYTTEDCPRPPEQSRTDRMSACWYQFSEPESNISRYEVAFIKVMNEAREGAWFTSTFAFLFI